MKSENNEADDDSSTVWLSNTNRGGLKSITDLAFELFVELEQFVYQHLTSMNKEDTASMDELYAAGTEYPDILRVWEQCILDSENERFYC